MLKQIGTQAKDAAAEIAVLSTDKKNQILQTMADELLKNSKKILAEINILDKVSSKNTILKIKIGEEIKFQNLLIKIFAHLQNLRKVDVL